MAYEDSKYYATAETLRETIDQFGVAIIPNVLTDKECVDMVAGIWDFFEHITQAWPVPISRTNEASWREFYKLYPLHSMLVQHWGIGHAQISWDLRQNEKLAGIYAQLYNCPLEDLLVSFDGMSLNMPPETTRRGWNNQNTWYHTDQTYTDNEFCCLQSWVTGLDVRDGDATLTFMEGSNRHHRECATQFNITDKRNWYKLNAAQEQFYLARGCAFKKIKCPRGSIVFWDSRNIHCGAEAMRTRAQPNFRAIVYLCYMPRQMCTAANLRKKQKAFTDLRTTSHWPCNPKLFGKSPQTYGAELPGTTPPSPPTLTELGRRLAGL